MKVYIATAFPNYRQAIECRDALRAAGHEVPASWISVAERFEGREPPNATEEDRCEAAATDLECINRANVLFLLVPESGGTGMWIEFGYALGWSEDILIYVIGDRKRSIFCELAHAWFDTFEEAIESLSK